jgi:MFS superfamily sulfate permease-like transporter
MELRALNNESPTNRNKKMMSLQDQPLLNGHALEVLQARSTDGNGQVEETKFGGKFLTRWIRELTILGLGNPFLSGNLMGSLSVAFVNMPMCMAFASAARLSPTVGITSAFWSSLFILFSDSKYSVISVAMSIALLSGPIITSYGEDGYHVALFCSAILLMVLMVTRLYKYMIIIPKCVMDGFMAGCVLGVFAEQLEVIFQVDIDGNKKGNLIMRLGYGLHTVFAGDQEINWFSVCLYFFITITLFALMKKFPSKPWVLFTCILGIAIGIGEDFVGGDNLLLRLSEQYENLSLRFFNFPSIGSRTTLKMLGTAQFYFDVFSLTLIIMLDSMITWGMMGMYTS